MTATEDLRKWVGRLRSAEAQAQFDHTTVLTAWNAPELVRAIEAVLDGPLDAERLYRAHIDVEGGYIKQPDRLTKTYWQKVAKRYNYLDSLRRGDES